MVTDLTLEKAKTMIRRSEAVKEQGQILKPASGENSQLDVVYYRPRIQHDKAFPSSAHK